MHERGVKYTCHRAGGKAIAYVRCHLLFGGYVSWILIIPSTCMNSASSLIVFAGCIDVYMYEYIALK